MLKSFRFWSLTAAILSFFIGILHVFGGGPEFHNPALASSFSSTWKAAFSTIWHETTALLLLNGIFLIAAALSWRKNNLLLQLIFLLNAAFATLFVFYAYVRLGSVWTLPQWILFTAMCALVAKAIWSPNQPLSTEEIAVDAAALNAMPGATYADTFINRHVTHATAREAAVQIFNQFPNWIDLLFHLRNWIVSFLGLIHGPSTGNGSAKSFGMFPVISETPTQIILGFDDRHLDFCIVISVHPTDKSMLLTTLVKPHNIWGKLYLAAVKPFHHLIVPTILSRAA